MIQASTLTDEQKNELKGHVHYRLKRPTVLAVNNSSEQMGTLQNLTQIIASAEYGEDQGQDPIKDKERAIFTRKFMRKYATYIDWAEVEMLKDEAKAENDQIKAQIDQQTAQNLQNAAGGMSGGMNDMGGGFGAEDFGETGGGVSSPTGDPLDVSLTGDIGEGGTTSETSGGSGGASGGDALDTSLSGAGL